MYLSSLPYLFLVWITLGTTSWLHASNLKEEKYILYEEGKGQFFTAVKKKNRYTEVFYPGMKPQEDIDGQGKHIVERMKDPNYTKGLKVYGKRKDPEEFQPLEIQKWDGETNNNHCDHCARQLFISDTWYSINEKDKKDRIDICLNCITLTALGVRIPGTMGTSSSIHKESILKILNDQLSYTGGGRESALAYIIYDYIGVLSFTPHNQPLKTIKIEYEQNYLPTPIPPKFIDFRQVLDCSPQQDERSLPAPEQQASPVPLALDDLPEQQDNTPPAPSLDPEEALILDNLPNHHQSNSFPIPHNKPMNQDNNIISLRKEGNSDLSIPIIMTIVVGTSILFSIIIKKNRSVSKK